MRKTDSRGSRKRSNVRLIWATIRQLYQMDARTFLLSASAGVIGALVYPLLLLIIWKGFSLLTAGASQGLLLQGTVLLIALFGVLAIQYLLKIVDDTATSILKAESSQDINARVMRKMSEIPYQAFEENDFQARYGMLMSQASYRPGQLVQTLISSLSTLISFLGITVLLFTIAPLLVVFLLVLIPLTVIETRFHRKTLQLQLGSAPDLFRMLYLSQKSIDATWQRDIRMHTSSILHDEHHVLGQRYLSHLKQLLRRFQGMRLGTGIAVAALITLAMAAVFWLISRGSSGLTEAGILLPAIYLGMSQGNAFAAYWGTLVECLGYIDQVFDFLHQPFESQVQIPLETTLPAWNDACAWPPPQMAIQLHEVSFKYPHATDKIAVSDVSYTFSTGTTAIVGPNGAGKSTLIKLVTGLLPPTSGRVSAQLLGGAYSPLKQLDIEHLYKSVLFQESSHFYLTIRQNITMRFERTPSEDADIYEALERAGLDKAVKQLPDGIDTLVGAGFGGKADLSGGQWQRLALARLIYQDAPVIILDEPLASLDPAGERAVFELFSQVTQAKIIIFTTHQYDSIPKNATIVVLVDGTITESGTHEELLQKHQDYWSLYMTAANLRQTGP